MASDEIKKLQREAKRAGIHWAAVLAAYDQIKAEESAGREHENEVRRHAWFIHRGAARPSKMRFWSCGFAYRYGAIAAAADFKAIAGYDVTAQEVAGRFPEYADDEGCERLWSFLLSPYRPMPRRDVMLRKALERVAAVVRPARKAKRERVPF